MKISASVLAIKEADIFKRISSESDKFDMVHVDIGDNVFCPTYGIPYEILEKIGEDSDFIIDTHFMINNPLNILDTIKNIRIDHLSLHCEAIDPFNLNKFKSDKYTLGIAILHKTDLSVLEPYLELVDSVLLLCVNPGFSYQDPEISPIDRVIEFNNIYPDYEGGIVVDGGVTTDMLNDLSKLGVTIAVQGGAIFGSK